LSFANEGRKKMAATEKIIILPPGLQALAALCAFDQENDDGLPEGQRYQRSGVKVHQDGDQVVCEATNGKVAGRYTANIGKRMDGQTRGQAFEALEKYPNFDAIIPKGAPLVAVRFDAELMIDLLRACQRVAGYSGAVTLELRGADKIIVLRAKNRDKGREFIGLQVPMANSNWEEE
jgi:hypothetical protein